MKINELLIPELQHETKLLQSFLERAPQDKLDWKPHEKSMTLGLLASHLVELYDWISATMNTSVMDMADYKPFRSDSVQEMLERLPQAAKEAQSALDKENSAYEETWSMEHNGSVIMPPMPKYTVLRSMVLNQFPHHRAQLGLYYRLLDISVPATYGPSADES